MKEVNAMSTTTTTTKITKKDNLNSLIALIAAAQVANIDGDFDFATLSAFCANEIGLLDKKAAKAKENAAAKKTEKDDLCILREDRHHITGKNEQKRPGNDHQYHFDKKDHPTQISDPLAVLCADRVAGQCGRRSLHAVSRDIKRGFNGIGDRMRRSGYLTEGIDHGGESNITKGGAKTLQSIGESDLQAASENHPVRFDGMASGRNSLVAPQSNGDKDTAQSESNGAGKTRTNDTHPRTRDQDLDTQN